MFICSGYIDTHWYVISSTWTRRAAINRKRALNSGRDEACTTSYESTTIPCSPLVFFLPFCASAKSLRSQTCRTVSPRKIISFLMSSTMRSCMPIHRSSPSIPACSVLDDDGSGGARRTTFHAVSVLSRVMLATLSCVTFASSSYVVGTGEGPSGSSTTEKECQ